MKTALLAFTGLLLPLSLHAQFSQPVRDVENPANNLFAARSEGSAPGNVTNAIMYVPSLPAGKRLRIEALTIRCQVPNAASITDAYIETRVKVSPALPPQYTKFHIHMMRQGEPGTSTTAWVGSLVGHVHAETTFTSDAAAISVFRSPANTGAMPCEYSLNGGLTNLPLQ